ncbi:histone deacetylase [Methanomethylovorans sp. PtaU1.Bin093]|uniref:histone deacetylase family protein n=1 Tax=Methanomethylovorans sp. PtaU1.Bin093 TaxID=1811679 RepID=UPI0025EE3477|nr:histone deacetylase [Methanomethylovorans sp. PtaU1.Bin093]
MVKEDGTGGLEKGYDAKDAMSKLNKLIALRFNDSSESMVKDQDDVSLRSVVQKIVISPEKGSAEDTVVCTDLKNCASSSVNDAVPAQQEQRSSVMSAGTDPGREWQNKLSELASTSFEEVSYESCELKLECPKPLVQPDVPAKASLPLSHTVTNTSAIVREPAGRSAIDPRSNTILKKKEDAIKSVPDKEKESAVLVQNGKGRETSVPDREKQAHSPDKITKGIARDMGDKLPVTEDIVSIMDKLDSIASEMKKKELPRVATMRMAAAERHIPPQQTNRDIKPSSFDTQLKEAPKGDRGIPAKVAVLYSEAHIAHLPKNTNVQDMERPERLTRAMDYLQRSGVFGERCDLITGKYPVSDQDLLLVHSDEYVRFVRSYSLSGGGFLGDSTYMTSNTFEVAGLAVGSAIQAGELVLSGQYSASMVMIRPPGHHAGVDKYRGFCIFNNVAVLARYLQKKKGISKVMIIDWDAHAGDGTMEIFYNDPTVMVVSLHRDPHDFYPRRGFSSQTGEGPGIGYTANVEMPVGAGDEEYAFAFDELVMPLLHSFSPDFVICSCGFDAYYKEEHIKLNLTSAGYHMMAKKIMSVMNGNFVLVMEGGYHKFNGHLTHVVINSLLGLPDPIADTLKATEYERNQQRSVMKETEKKISYVKEMLGIQDQ